MKAEDIADRESFLAWLNERGNKLENDAAERDSLAVVHRAVMRVLPAVLGYYRWSAAGFDPCSAALRLNLLAAVALRSPSKRVTKALSAACDAAESLVAGTQYDAFQADHAQAFINEGFEQAEKAAANAAAAASAFGVTISAAAIIGKVRSFTPEGIADLVASCASAEEAMWEAVRSDCSAIEADLSPQASPLWPGRNPLAAQLGEARDWMRSSGEDWDFWLRWYEKALGGWAQDWNLLADIALIPQEDWDKGPEHVNGLIAELQLKRAVAQTPNAEVISVNAATLKLRADPLSEMPGDHLEEAIEKLQSVANLFGRGADGTNQHRAIEPERALIADATDKYARRPRMLHSTCIRVLRRMDVRIRNGECPSQEQDADIADFYATVLGVSIDLYERDPLVREAADHMASVRLRELTPDEAETIVKAADEVANLSEGALASELPEQARTAVDVGATPAERKEALYVTTSRLLRSGLILVKVTLKEIEEVSGTVAGIAKNAAIIGVAVQTTPTWLRPAIDILLRLF